MKLRFKLRPKGTGKGAATLRSMLVNVPGRLVLMTIHNGKQMPYDIDPDYLAEFEARHSAIVLAVRRPARRVRA